MTKIVSINPSNLLKIGQVDSSTQEQISGMVADARKALVEWKRMGLEKRIQILKTFSENLDKHQDELAVVASEEMGMPITQSRADILDALKYFNWYLQNAAEYLTPEKIYQDNLFEHIVVHEPIGVAAVITPWNYPLSNFIWGVGQNLIVGNTVVFKHSEEIPIFTQKLEEIVKKSSLPVSVLSFVYGGADEGEYLVKEDINLICFTGSTQVGRKLFKLGGEKFIKVILELGGSAPGIVVKDAEIDSTIENIYFSRFSNCGQMCDALKRLIVEKDIFDDVVEKLKNYLRGKIMKHSMDPGTEIGPLVSKKQLERLEEQVKDAVQKGAKVILGGKRNQTLDGYFYEPTLLTNVSKDMRVWREEVFGPVLPIIPFENEEEAIEMANDTSFGLGAYVFTEDKGKAMKLAKNLDSGMVSINGKSYVQPHCPFGGYKNSGMGREHGKYGFEELTQVKVIAI